MFSQMRKYGRELRELNEDVEGVIQILGLFRDVPPR